MRKSVIFGLSILLILLAPPLASPQTEEAAIYTITMNYKVTNNGSYNAENVRMVIFLFDNVSGWADQTVLSENIDGVTILHEESTDDNRWMRISFGDLQPGQSKTATVTQTLKVNAVDFSVDPNNVGTSFPQELVDNFTSSVNGLFESSNSTIQALAQQLTENTTNPYYMAKQIFDFVLEDPDDEQDLVYEQQQVEHGALWALQSGKGDCTEFSNLFIALARAVGIPAKAVSGYGYLTALYSPTAGGTDASQLPHAYPIFYLPNYGWVPADAVWPQYLGSFCKMDYAHIAGGNTGGEGIVQGGTIYWPNPGAYRESVWTHYTGQETSVDFSWSSGTITPEVLVDASLQASSSIQDDVMTLTMTIKNMGQSSVSDLTAQPEVDSTYFEVLTSPQQKSSLASGEEWVETFDLRVNESAYGNRHTFTSEVTYDGSYGGTSGAYLVTGQRLIDIGAKPTLPQQVYDLMLYMLIGVLVGVIVVVGVALARR